MNGQLSVVRSATTAVLGAAATSLLVPETIRLGNAALRGPVEALGPADLIGAGALLLGTVGAGWIAVASALLTVLALARAAGARAPRLARIAGAVAPRLLQRLVVVGVGAVVGLAPQVAVAAEVDLGWTVSDPADPADPAAPTSGRTADARPVSADVTRMPESRLPQTQPTVTVTPGDSLWTLTREQLGTAHGSTPSDAEVAAAWPTLWTANRAVVGEDPDLLHPGQVLTLPSALRASPVPPVTSPPVAPGPPTPIATPTDVLEENR